MNAPNKLLANTIPHNRSTRIKTLRLRSLNKGRMTINEGKKANGSQSNEKERQIEGLIKL
jgi:hypothetical protein